MRKRLLTLAVVCTTVGACASELRPINNVSFTTGATPCVMTPSLEKSICQAHGKSEELMDASFKLRNDPALFDAPLLALASAAAGLLLFDANVNALKGVGLAAASLTAGRAYASPSEIRDALRSGSTGYACLADAGQLVKDESAKVTGLDATRKSLEGKLVTLASLMRDTRNFTGGDLTRARGAVAKARSAITLYKRQASALRFANNTLRDKARKLSKDLLKKIERQPIDFAAIYQQIAQSAANTAAFQVSKTQAQPVAPAASAELKEKKRPRGDKVVADVETATRRLLDVPDIETAVAKFDTCVANSTSGTS